jgi:hypothetical protein
MGFIPARRASFGPEVARKHSIARREPWIYRKTFGKLEKGIGPKSLSFKGPHAKAGKDDGFLADFVIPFN